MNDTKNPYTGYSEALRVARGAFPDPTGRDDIHLVWPYGELAQHSLA